MIQIITGEDTFSGRKQILVGAGIIDQTILTDSHPKDIFKQCEELVKYYGNTKQVHNVFTFNMSAIQALFYFSRKMKKQEPKIIFHYKNGNIEEIGSNEISRVFENLITPLEQMFKGDL